jgi:drug/metabolite transporter (DMT)-like permease
MSTVPESRAARNTRAVLAMILSVAMLALVDGIAKIAAGEGMHPFMIAFFRNLFGLVAMVPFFMRVGLARMKTTRLRMHLVRGAFHTMAMLCWFTALTLVPLAEATAMIFITPIFASIGAVLIMGEGSRLLRWASVAIGFAGMLIILRPGIADWNIGALLLIFNAITIAGVKLMIKSLSRTDTPVTIVAYMSLTLTVFSFLPALFVWQWPNPWLLFLLASMGGIGTVAHVIQTYSYRDGEITLVEPSSYMRLVWAAAVGYLLFGEVPGIWTWIGGAVIAGGAILLLRDEIREARAARTAPSGTISP